MLWWFRSTDVIKIDHFRSTFLFFVPFLCCCFHHFQWNTHKIIQDCGFFPPPAQHCLFSFPFFCFVAEALCTFWSDLPFLSFFLGDLLTNSKTQFNFQVKSHSKTALKVNFYMKINRLNLFSLRCCDGHHSKEEWRWCLVEMLFLRIPFLDKKRKQYQMVCG